MGSVNEAADPDEGARVEFAEANELRRVLDDTAREYRTVIRTSLLSGLTSVAGAAAATAALLGGAAGASVVAVFGAAAGGVLLAAERNLLERREHPAWAWADDVWEEVVVAGATAEAEQ